MVEEEEKRQYNLGILILLVVLCWPAALIYYYTRPKVRRKVRICQGCGRQIPLEYNVCPYCGKSVFVQPTYTGMSPAPPPPPPPGPSPGTRFCTNCGAKIETDDRFCPICGARVE